VRKGRLIEKKERISVSVIPSPPNDIKGMTLKYRRKENETHYVLLPLGVARLRGFWLKSIKSL